MRIGTTFPQLSGVTEMMAQQAKLSHTQMQLSTGKRLLTPADDPNASVRAMSLTTKIEATKQYGSNINYMKEYLDVEESALQGGIDSLQRAREVVVNALNHTHPPSDLAALASDIDQVQQEIFTLMNTQDAHGEYLFSGITSQTQPYTKSALIQAPGYGYSFQGDVNVRILQTASIRQMQEGDSGFNIFDDIPAKSVTASSNNGKQNVLSTLQVLSDVMRGTIRAGAGGIVGTDISALFAAPGYIPVAPDNTFDLSVDGAAAVSVTIPPPTAPATTYPNIHSLVSAINTEIANTTLSGVQAFAQGNSLQFVSTQSTGPASSITISNTSGLGFANLQTGVGQQLQGNAVLSASTPPSFPIDYAVPATFFLSVNNGAQIQVDVPAGSYADAAAFTAGINAGIGATALAEVAMAQVNGGSVELVTVASGQENSIQVFDGNSTFRSDAGFAYQQIAMGKSLTHEAMADLLADVDSALSHMSDIMTTIGARKNALDQQSDVHGKFILDMNTALSETQDLDYTEAISRFNLQQTSLQAAQQSYVKVQNLSLFNYLR